MFKGNFVKLKTGLICLIKGRGFLRKFMFSEKLQISEIHEDLPHR